MSVRLALLAILAALTAIPAAVGLVIVEHARTSIYFGDGIRYLRHTPAPTEPARLIAELDYEMHDVLVKGLPVPRVFVSDLPERLSDLTVRERKQVFTHLLLPLILRVNELIQQDRRRLIGIRERLSAGLPLDEIENRWLAALARTYRLGGAVANAGYDFDELMLRVDAIPPSLALAQAAIESGWGTSRFAQSGNALFGQWVWGAKGLVPGDRDDGKDHMIGSYEYLIQSIRSYARNLNTHRAYRGFRTQRAGFRVESGRAPGLQLAETLTAYSQRGDEYVREVKAIIASNRFAELEMASLEPSWWAAP